jgi:hypothetical protein
MIRGADAERERGRAKGRGGAERHASHRSLSPPLALRGAAVAVVAGLLSACAHKPPADFAPDPGLVTRIAAIRIDVPAVACPGQTIDASYTAVLDDGSEVPFATRYDEKHPPPLHVVFLNRYSPTARALENGNWDTADDPLLSALDGFRLRAILRAKPGVMAEVVVPPVYDCLDHAFAFEGERGDRGSSGGPGPDVTVRLALGSSPFVGRLIVAEIAVAAAPPFYVLADADAVPPADWLVVASRGGPGGRGRDGTAGAKGLDGSAGCPGGPGGAGGAGGSGGPGGPGGRGGHVTVIAPENDPFLAGLVDARSEGGPGGLGGKAGTGGAGGAGGGVGVQGDVRRCTAGPRGADGPDGRPGREGPQGEPGQRPQVITVPVASVFGSRPRPELAALLTYHQGDDR